MLGGDYKSLTIVKKLTVPISANLKLVIECKYNHKNQNDCVQFLSDTWIVWINLNSKLLPDIFFFSRTFSDDDILCRLLSPLRKNFDAA